MRTNWTGTKTLFGALLVISALAGAAIFGGEMVTFLVIGVMILIPLERLFKRHDYPMVRPGMLTDALHAVFTGLIASLIVAVLVSLMSPLAIGTIAEPFSKQSLWLQGILAFLLAELAIYWQHRLAHEIPFLWRFHSVHHSSRYMDWLAGERRHPVDGAWAALFTSIPLALIGLDGAQAGAIVLFAELWDLIIHANVRWRVRWMDRIWVSPEMHHWHHAEDEEAWDKNYAGAIAIYDVIFGTYYMPKDKRPTTYGIPGGISDRYLDQMIHPFKERPGEGEHPNQT